WVDRFLKRHPEICFKKGWPLDPCRVRAFNPTTVNAHFTLLEAVISSFDIPVENIYNMNKKGVQLG
ncbi:hypothetical protein M422DRAFT_110397, partial [Sphaerobolus stellatus SS14]